MIVLFSFFSASLSGNFGFLSAQSNEKPSSTETAIQTEMPSVSSASVPLNDNDAGLELAIESIGQEINVELPVLVQGLSYNFPTRFINKTDEDFRSHVGKVSCACMRIGKIEKPSATILKATLGATGVVGKLGQSIEIYGINESGDAVLFCRLKVRAKTIPPVSISQHRFRLTDLMDNKLRVSAIPGTENVEIEMKGLISASALAIHPEISKQEERYQLTFELNSEAMKAITESEIQIPIEVPIKVMRSTAEGKIEPEYLTYRDVLYVYDSERVIEVAPSVLRLTKGPTGFTGRAIIRDRRNIPDAEVGQLEIVLMQDQGDQVSDLSKFDVERKPLAGERVMVNLAIEKIDETIPHNELRICFRSLDGLEKIVMPVVIDGD